MQLLVICKLFWIVNASRLKTLQRWRNDQKFVCQIEESLQKISVVLDAFLEQPAQFKRLWESIWFVKKLCVVCFVMSSA